MLGRARDDLSPGCRSFPQGRHAIFYEVTELGIVIIGILHQSMDVQTHFDSED